MLESCVQILPECIQDEYVRVPVEIAYWGQQYADAQRAHAEAKIRADRMYYDLSVQAREAAAAAGQRVTEGLVEAIVQRTPEYRNAGDAVVAAEHSKLRVHAITEALKAKRDMLISLGAHQRAELERDPVIRER